MSGETKTLATRVALEVASAMQVAIAAWQDPTVRAMTDEARSVFMTEVTKQFAGQILDLVSQKLGEKSSS